MRMKIGRGSRGCGKGGGMERRGELVMLRHRQKEIKNVIKMRDRVSMTTKGGPHTADQNLQILCLLMNAIGGSMTPELRLIVCTLVL